MQNQVYSRYIYQMLMEYGRVCIPSVGTFILDYTEATIDRSAESISPPSSALHFSTTMYDDFICSGLLIESGMSKENALLIENLAIQDYRISEEKNIPFELFGLGNLVNHVFVEKEAGTFNRFYGLKDVVAIPVVANPGQVKHDETYLYNLKKIQQPKEKSFFHALFWPALISVITILVILLWLFNDRNRVAEQAANTSVMEDDVHEPLILSDTTAMDTTAVSQANDTVLFPENGLIDLVEDSNLNEAGVVIHQGQPEKIGPSCVIIVGAFKNSANANRMIKRITSKGYVVYSGTHKGFRRVGIIYDCSSIDPAVFKIKVREEFKSQAWHLHDTI
jgi:cell division septation protein DedD